MIKIGKQDLTDITDIKNTRLSHTFYQEKFFNFKKMQFNNFLMGINKKYFLIEFCFDIIAGNTCIAQPNLEVLPIEFQVNESTQTLY